MAPSSLHHKPASTHVSLHTFLKSKMKIGLDLKSKPLVHTLHTNTENQENTKSLINTPGTLHKSTVVSTKVETAIKDQSEAQPLVLKAQEVSIDSKDTSETVGEAETEIEHSEPIVPIISQGGPPTASKGTLETSLVSTRTMKDSNAALKAPSRPLFELVQVSHKRLDQYTNSPLLPKTFTMLERFYFALEECNSIHRARGISLIFCRIARQLELMVGFSVPPLFLASVLYFLYDFIHVEPWITTHHGGRILSWVIKLPFGSVACSYDRRTLLRTRLLEFLYHRYCRSAVITTTDTLPSLASICAAKIWPGPFSPESEFPTVELLPQAELPGTTSAAYPPVPGNFECPFHRLNDGTPLISSSSRTAGGVLSPIIGDPEPAAAVPSPQQHTKEAQPPEKKQKLSLLDRIRQKEKENREACNLALEKRAITIAGFSGKNLLQKSLLLVDAIDS